MKTTRILGLAPSCISVLTALFLILASAGPAVDAQDLFQIGGGSAGGGFSVKNFGVDFGAEAADKTLTVDAAVLDAPDNVDAAWNDAETGAQPVGFLAITTTAADGWHIYTATQGPGGKPTQFVDLAVSPENAGVTVGTARLATEWTDAKSALGDNLEELFGASEWIAPLYADGDVDLTSLSITGQVDALACSEGDGGTCVPQKVEFTAKYAERYAVPILEAAQKLMAAPQEEPAAEQPGAEQTQTEVAESDPAAEQPAAPGHIKSYTGARFLILLLMAFFGGLILNITPCVLPVVGLKILSFFEQAGRSRKSAFLLNVWYTLGVMIVFGVLACFVSGLSSLFTHGLFQILMSAIVFVMALSLMGVWELETPAFLGGSKSTELSQKEGPAGAVFKGVITTLLAIPCGAPLLSPTLNWASSQPFGVVFAVYLVIGLGMASPFLLAGAFPELLKFFPKPGEWMETFRKTMGYFLLIAVLWILYSAPLEYLVPSIACLFALWFACWNVGRNQWEVENPGKKAKSWIVSLIVLAIVVVCSFNFPGNPNKTTLESASEAKLMRWAVRAERSGALEKAQGEHWALFSPETLEAELQKGRTVAVDFTADWCMNCKFLEKTILHTPEIEKLFDEKNILTLTVDWTNQDAQTPDILAINELLDANGARQVPTLMIFTPQNPDKPIVLTGLYSKAALVETLNAL